MERYVLLIFKFKKLSKVSKKIIIYSTLAISFLTITTGALHFTSQPNFCTSCHQIKPQVTSWQSGPHKTVTCLKCHAEPGTLGYLKRKISGLSEVYLQVSNQVPSKIDAKPYLDSCITCHSGNNNYPMAKNIKLKSGDNAPKISHIRILEDGVSCLGCHQNVGHTK